MQPALARAVAERLAVGGQVFLQSDVKKVAEDMLSVFTTAAGDLLELDAAHFGDGASADWPPPEADHINQGDDEQRAAMRAASARKRKAEARLAAAGSGKEAREQDAPPHAAPFAEPPQADAPAEPAAAAAAAAVESEERGSDNDDDDEPAVIPGNGWLRHNPVGVPTERELGTVKAGGHVWRCLLVRKNVTPAQSAAL